MDFKLETVPIVVSYCFPFHNICKMRTNCEIDDQEVQALIQRHKHVPNRPGSIYSYIYSEEQKIRKVIKEYFEQNLPDAY